MASLNVVVLIGNCTRDVETKYLQSGTAVCDVGLAVNERVKRGEEWVDEAVFVDVTCFGKTAEVAGQYLSKGAPVAFQGRLKLDQWEKDGEKRSKLKVVADKLQLLGGKPRESQERPESRQEHNQTDPHQERVAAAQAPPDDGSIPF